jgi:hypothetical protein
MDDYKELIERMDRVGLQSEDIGWIARAILALCHEIDKLTTVIAQKK